MVTQEFIAAVWRVIHRADLERCEGCALANSSEFDVLRQAYEHLTGRSASGTIADQPWYPHTETGAPNGPS